MSITYEEALETLESMFGAPWTRESLDQVLRHFQGHMENTVESILSHGEGDPAALLTKLTNQSTADSTTTAATQNDQELARQLARQEQVQQQQRTTTTTTTTGTNTGTGTTTRPSPPQSKKKGRGTAIDLPPDFLRVPNYSGRGGQEGGQVMDQDEALARMLQDELFSQELANNPEFAHLARGRQAARGGGQSQRASQQQRASAAAHQGPQFDGKKMMKNITEMGNETKKKLLMFGAQWSNRFAGSAAGESGAAGAAGGSSGVAHETRGLLDGDDGEEMEMTFAAESTHSKNQ
mmetsp:Transcript_11648/g.19378  ORF Transcript_11648/g.19378 Transcript_11648/m.19378 type:complete len:293 (+) Transcript_11648:133-1011(+)|eukprot:CAMPEP_0119012496 /NCGR_PEP_ID=MMETSP1176-20130426/6817_1 /TAXON_ID=265551 /ORGANISM="Synedropsis recta cf, Strain CCMP1620" /LENGTH=292 /DNA_ID=CAMNT_0006965471 /DNA_START=133 /DNA_END=1011 /DNA_ORIENTATION=+